MKPLNSSDPLFGPHLHKKLTMPSSSTLKHHYTQPVSDMAMCGQVHQDKNWMYHLQAGSASRLPNYLATFVTYQDLFKTWKLVSSRSSDVVNQGVYLLAKSLLENLQPVVLVMEVTWVCWLMALTNITHDSLVPGVAHTTCSLPLTSGSQDHPAVHISCVCPIGPVQSGSHPPIFSSPLDHSPLWKPTLALLTTMPQQAGGH